MKPTSRHQHWNLLIAALVAAIVYVAASAVAVHFMDERNGVVDGTLFPNRDHWAAARNMMTGRETRFYLPPGFYGYMLLAVTASQSIGQSYFFWRLIEDAVSTAVTALVVFRLMMRMSGSTWAGWGAVIVLIYNVAYSAGTATDLPMAAFLPWFFGGLFMLITAGEERSSLRALAAGALLAASSFFRADILLFVPFFWIISTAGQFAPPVGVKNRHHAGKIFVLALLGFAFTVLPWSLYTASQSGSVLLYSSYFARSHVDGMLRFPGNPVSDAFRSLSVQLQFASIVDLIKLHLSLAYAYPVQWLQLFIEKIWRPWYASDSGRWDAILAVQSVFLSGPVLAGIYLWIRRRGVDFALIIAASIIAYFWILTVIAPSLNRIMPPAYPFLGMFAGFAAEAVWQTRLARPDAVRSSTPVAELKS